MIKRSTDCVVGGHVDREALITCIDEHQDARERLNRLDKHVHNEHAILERNRGDKPNNRLIHNYARYIVKMASGYLIGSPVSYAAESQKQALTAVMDEYKRFDASAVDMELARDASKFGRAVELLYPSATARPCSAAVDPRNAFVCYDDTVEKRPLFGVHYTRRIKLNGEPGQWRVDVYTDNRVENYLVDSLDDLIIAVPSSRYHYFGSIPINEYWNDEDEAGDFEWVMTLIDALDVLQSDRINDKEQFVNALLVLVGCTLEPDEKDRTPREQIKQDGILKIPGQGADAKYLTLTLDEDGVETLKKSIKEDIHKLSLVPDLTDKEFAVNSSGVAMGYKLFGFTQLISGKERYFRQALRWRLRMMSRFMAVKGSPKLDPEQVTITFSRSLPSNDVETATVIQDLQGIVPDELLIKRLPWIEDPEKALEMLKKQLAEAEKRKATAFNMPVNTPTGEVPANKPDGKTQEPEGD